MTQQVNAVERAMEMKNRTKHYALRVIKLFKALPKTEEARVIGRQLLRAGTSVGANFPCGLPRSIQGGVYCQGGNRGGRD